MKKIIDYLVKTCHQKPEAAVKVAQPFAKYNDICTELKHWIETQEYPQDNPLTVEGYTAKKVSELAPFMNGIGVYNFLVTLRERPDNAKRIIAAGFPRK